MSKVEIHREQAKNQTIREIPLNGIILQGFHWYYQFDIRTSLWYELKNRAEWLKEHGFTAIWIPPPQKSSGGCNDNGFMPYDYYDLGEFDQKGTIRTKWGSKQEFDEMVTKFHSCNVEVYSDMVMNHMDGGDEKELVEVEQFDEWDRNKVLGKEKVWAWTKFNYWGRKGKYADFWVDKNWFDWLGFVERDDEKHTNLRGLFRLAWKPGNSGVSSFDQGSGSYDYLTGLDLDVEQPFVAQRLEWVGEWMIKERGVDGFRLDAVKHLNYTFLENWCKKLREWTGKPVFCFGEYVSGNVEDLHRFLENTHYSMSLFDFPLHFNFVSASRPEQTRRTSIATSLNNLVQRFDYGFYHQSHTSMHGDAEWELEFDLRTLFQGTLVQKFPNQAVTFLDTHDSQPLRSLAGSLGDADWVQSWFRPHGYACILFREHGYPCVFYPDVFGAEYWSHWNQSWHEYHVQLSPVPHLDWMTQLRRTNALGVQRDYIEYDDPNCVPPRPNPARNLIGWTREGIDVFPWSGIAVVLCNTRKKGVSTVSVPVAEDGVYPQLNLRHTKWMYVGERHRNKRWRHFVDSHRFVYINNDGWGNFCVADGECGCWIPDPEEVYP